MDGNLKESRKLNIGCGLDRRNGYINIDGGADLSPDKVMKFPKDRLIEHFAPESVDEVLMQDFLEHHFRWEAEQILRDVNTVLAQGGILKIRVPDFIRIVLDFRISWEQKIMLLWGGQDIPQHKGDDSVRKEHPEFFCHKYAYTKNTLKKFLIQHGFKVTYCMREGTNIWAHCVK